MIPPQRGNNRRERFNLPLVECIAAECTDAECTLASCLGLSVANPSYIHTYLLGYVSSFNGHCVIETRDNDRLENGSIWTDAAEDMISCWEKIRLLLRQSTYVCIIHVSMYIFVIVWYYWSKDWYSKKYRFYIRNLLQYQNEQNFSNHVIGNEKLYLSSIYKTLNIDFNWSKSFYKHSTYYICEFQNIYIHLTNL